MLRFTDAGCSDVAHRREGQLLEGAGLQRSTGEPASVLDEQHTGPLGQWLHGLTCQACHCGLVRRTVADHQGPAAVGK